MKYHCHDCDNHFESEEIVYLCPECEKTNKEGEFRKGVLEVELSDEIIKNVKNKEKVTPFDFFPYPECKKDAFPVGPTPVVVPYRINEKYNTNFKLKLDSQLLSGSFKDRASQLIAFQAISQKQNKIVLASTGNAGAAMSAIGAAYGLEIVLFVPATAPINKLMQSILYNARVIPVDGTYDDAFKLSIEYTKKFGGINRNTAYNPMTIEGKKSISIELFEQLGRQVPDKVYVSTGDGCIFSGVYKGFKDLLTAGLIDKLPQLICCQSKESNAISQAFITGENKTVKATTLADSISVSNPANALMAVRAIKESGGYSIEVSDGDILKYQRELLALSGIFVEPAAATAYAAAVLDKEKGENPLILLTGTGFKDMSVFSDIKLPKAIKSIDELTE